MLSVLHTVSEVSGTIDIGLNIFDSKEIYQNNSADIHIIYLGFLLLLLFCVIVFFSFSLFLFMPFSDNMKSSSTENVKKEKKTKTFCPNICGMNRRS